jgi:hypothetical protein
VKTDEGRTTKDESGLGPRELSGEPEAPALGRRLSSFVYRPSSLAPGARIFLANVVVNAAHRLRSPIFADGRFELVPIPEAPGLEGPRLVRYADLRCHNDPREPLARYLPAGYLDRPAHHDPEFVTPSYGDNCWRAARAAALRGARPGDWIVFLARLCGYREGTFAGPAGFYLVGALEVAAQLGPVRGPLAARERARFAANAHVRRAEANPRFYDGFCVFRGTRRSRRFERAVPFPRALAAALLRDARGAPWVWPDHRSELQVIGSYTRTIRAVHDPGAFWRVTNDE